MDDIDVFIRGALSPAAISQAIADEARSALAEGEAQNRSALGYVPEHSTRVDGAAEVPLDRVRPDGEIVFTFDVGATDVVLEVLAALREHSPVLTGAYRAAHVVLADGVRVDGDNFPPAQVYEIVNTQPYARKIERGESSQAADGVYEAVAAIMAQRFGNRAAIAFSYRSPLIEYAAGAARAQTPARRSAQRLERATRAPSITIRMR